MYEQLALTSQQIGDKNVLQVGALWTWAFSFESRCRQNFIFSTAIAPIFTNPIAPPSFTYYARNVSVLVRPRKAPDWGHTVANFISSKSIKYLKCTWHSADFTTAAPLKVNGAENLFIYADDRCGTLRLGQWTHRGPGVGGGGGRAERVICAPDENINPGLALFRKCSGEDRRRGSLTCYVHSLGERSSFLAARRRLLAEHMCWPASLLHIKTKLQCAHSQENVEGWGLSKCQRLGLKCLHISEWCMDSSCAIYSPKQ